MDRKPPSSLLSWFFTPAFKFDLSHLEEMVQLAGPNAKLHIETRDYRLEGIDELIRHEHAPTELERLSVTFGQGDWIQVIPDLRATGERANAVADRLAHVRASARRWFSLSRAMAMFAVIVLLPAIPEAAGSYFGAGTANWSSLKSWFLPNVGTPIMWMLAVSASIFWSASGLSSRIDPRKRKDSFWPQNKERILTAVVTTTAIGVGSAVLLYIKGLL
jgi:hypothetical protein